MSDMFHDWSSLQKLNLSSFNTHNVTDMSGMFHGCLSLTKLDIFNFNINGEIDMSYIFLGCPKELIKKYKSIFIKNDF